MKKLISLFLPFVITISAFPQSRLEIAKQHTASHPVAKSAGPFENCYDAEPINSSAPIVVPFVNGFDEFEFLGGSCLSTNEHQVRWYQFSFSTAGTFEFICTPDALGADYDFALWKGGCPSALCSPTPAEVVACDYSGPINNPPFVPTGISNDPNGTFGVTGLTEFGPTITVEPFINYYLLIDNITSNGVGFSLEFAGTAAMAAPVSNTQIIIPDTLCSNAPLVDCPCLETGISISTSEPNASPAPPNFCGSVENQKWIKFQACWCTIDLEIENLECDFNGGVEAQLFSSCGPNFTPKSNCTFIPVGTTGGFNNINCTPGEFIYLMIDGLNGDMCDVNVVVEEGPTPPVVILQDTIFGQTTACEGDTLVYFSPPVFNAAHCDFSYFGNGSTSEPSHDSVVVVLGAGMGELCFNAINCSSSQTVCIDVNVLPTEYVITDTISICLNNLPYIYGNATINFSGVFEYDTLQNAVGCDSILQVEAIIYDSVQCSINATGELSSPNGVVLQNIISYPFGLYSYLWSGPGINISNQNDFEQTVFVPGQYELVITDIFSGCTASSSIFLSAIDTCASFNYPVAPSDSCQNAPPFCADYLNGYCSINDGYSANIPGNLSNAFDCTIENNQWLSFMACDTTVTFVFSVGDCNVGTGLEFGVFQTDDCLDYLALATCLSVESGVTDTLTIDNLIPGGQYLLMVDGISGSVCQWHVNGLEGASGEAYIQENITPGHIEGESNICLGLNAPPSDEFTYTVVPPICQYNPSDADCNGDTATCQPAPQQFCEPHLDTMYNPIAYDTIWHISPHTAGHFVNDDSIGASVDVVWDSIGTFLLGANIVAVEWDTVPFWNDCIGLCTIVCGDPEGDNCIIEPLEVTIDNSDVFDLFFEKCPEECITAFVPNPVDICSPGFYVFGNPDNCEDIFNVTVIDFQPQNINEEIFVCQGDCTIFLGQPYCSGFYEIPYIDINGCNAIIFLDVIEGPAPIVFITGEDEINCLNPEATLSADSSPPFLIGYNWSNGMNGSEITVNTGGLYTVTVTDFNGCTGEASFFVDENIQNEEEDLGEIFLCPSECFELNGNMYCDAGIYSEEFIDPNSGCTITYLFTIIIQVQTPMQIGPVSELCDGINEYYTVGFNIINGVSPFTVNGNVINGDFYQSDPILAGDPYFFDVTDNNTCGNNQEVVQGFFECPCITDAGTMELALLNQCEDEMVTPDFNDNEILDANDMLVFVLHDNSGNSLGNILGTNATGTFGFIPGLMQYGETYFISPVAGNNDNGNVDFTSTCLNIGQGQPVIFHQSPEVEIIAPQTLTCNSPDGAINTTIIAGGSGQLSYSWSGPGSFQSNEMNPIINEGGGYTLTVLDIVSGCEISVGVSVEEDFVIPTLNANVGGVIDCNNPQTTLLVTSQQANVVYEWTSPSGNNLSGDNIVVSESGEYSVYATALNGCTAEATLEVLENTSPPDFELMMEDVSCLDSEANLTASSSDPSIVYEWTLPDNTSFSGSVLETGIIGNYEVIATGANGCTSEQTLAVNEISGELLILDLEFSDPTCFGMEDGFITIEEIVGATGIVNTMINGQIFTGSEMLGLAAGEYELEVIDAEGCIGNATVQLINPQEVTVTLGDDLFVQENTQVHLDFQSSIIPATILWNSSHGFEWDGVESLAILATENDTYTITIADPNGCSDSDELAIYINGQEQVFIPNAFSPNGDQQNDYLTVLAGEDVETVVSFKIFNRWGDLVFSKENFEPNNPTLGWDGTYKNKKLNPAVFAYMAEVVFKTGETKTLSGDVLLLK